MGVLSEHGLISDSDAQTTNLVCNVSRLLKHGLEGQIAIVGALINVLDGAWVAVMVHEPPQSFLGLEHLIRHVV